MKTIKVFIASSEELKQERDAISAMIPHINSTLKPRDIEIYPEMWEYLDSSMGVKHKQEEYNDVLKTCELCLVMFWTRFGEYTKIELDTAYNELKAGRNPQKLYVYFKEVDLESITPELKEFKDNMASYERQGHFYRSFKNIDTVKLDFLIQFEKYQNTILQGFTTIRNSMVEFGGTPVSVINLQNIPFYGNNAEYKQLVEAIKDNEELLQLRPNDVARQQKLHDLREKLEQMENNILNTAKLITQQLNSKSSAMLAEAISLFEQGDCRGANALLKQDDMRRSGRAFVDGINENYKGFETTLEQYRLKISLEQSIMDSGWVQRVIELYQEITDMSRSVSRFIPQEQYAELLFDYAGFLMTNRQYHLLGSLYDECLDECRKLNKTKPGAFLFHIANVLNNSGVLHNAQGQYSKAEAEYVEALNIYERLTETVSDDFLYRTAEIYNNLGSLYYSQQLYSKAETKYNKALSIYMKSDESESSNVWEKIYSLGDFEIVAQSSNTKAAIARTLNNLGVLHAAQERYSESETEYNEASKIYRQLAKTDPDAFSSDVGDTLYNLGRLYVKTINYDKAIECWKEALACYIYIKRLKNTDMHDKTIETIKQLITNSYFLLSLRQK